MQNADPIWLSGWPRVASHLCHDELGSGEWRQNIPPLKAATVLVKTAWLLKP